MNDELKGPWATSDYLRTKQPNPKYEKFLEVREELNIIPKELDRRKLNDKTIFCCWQFRSVLTYLEDIGFSWSISKDNYWYEVCFKHNSRGIYNGCRISTDLADTLLYEMKYIFSYIIEYYELYEEYKFFGDER